jgi:hypothetical protein
MLRKQPARPAGNLVVRNIRMIQEARLLWLGDRGQT